MGTAASSFLNPIAAELEGAGPKPTAKALSRRAQQRRQIQGIIGVSYVIDAFVLLIYAHAGTIPAIIGPAYAGFDTGIHKTFRMPWGEHQRLQFRAAAFNVFNSVNFNDAGGSLTLDPTSPSTFGKFSNTAGVGGRGGAREMEFAIRYEF